VKWTAGSRRQSRRRGTRADGGADRGDVTAQLVILTPLMVLLIMLIVQMAVYFHAANVATAAAQSGAEHGAARGARSEMATRASEQTVSDLGGHLASAPEVETDGELVRVAVRVDVAGIVPFFPSTVERAAVSPRERFVPEGDR